MSSLNMLVFVCQTAGVELLMKCVHIPETSDSVVSLWSALSSMLFVGGGLGLGFI